MKDHIYISILGIALYAFHESDFGEGTFCDGKVLNKNYRDPDNCGGYITCAAGYPVGIKRLCPAGLHYNGLICDWPRNVVCNKGPATTTAPTAGPATTTAPTAVDGGYSSWSAFGDCSKTCESGFKTRTRTCTNPAPTQNGRHCSGLPEETETCNLGACPSSPKTAVLQCGKQTFSRRVRRYLPEVGKIVGGRDASGVRRMWQAAMYYKGKMACGGTLIAPDLVLTAASCVPPKRKLRDWSVMVGDHQRSREEGSEQKLYVDKIIVHEDKGNNDIAILKLKTKATLNEKVGIVCLPEADSEVPEGTRCYITGWGSTDRGAGKKYSSDVLQEAELPVLSKEKCNVQNDGHVTDNMLCGGKERNNDVSACRWDTGGPYVCRSEKGDGWVIQGVVSWGSRRCDPSDKYTVFTRVSKYVTWIKNNS